MMRKIWAAGGLLLVLTAFAKPILAGQGTTPVTRPGSIINRLNTNAVTGSPPAPSNVPAFATVTGIRTGNFKGEGAQGASGRIPFQSFDYEVISPRDIATGQASGKRQHKPIHIVKEWGASSPQFLQALVSNETLKTVTLEFTKVNPNGEVYVYQTIKLTNATVTSIHQFTAQQDAASASNKRVASGSPWLEDIAFTFQRIELTNNDGKTMFVDDWTAR